LAERKCGVIGTMKQLKKVVETELPFFALLPALLWQLLFFGVPLFIILYASFTHNTVFTLEHYYALANSAYFKVIGRSLFLAVANVIVCLLIAYPAAYCLAVHVKRFRQGLLFLLVLPFWTNFLVQIYGWFFILERHGLINTMLLRIGIISEPLLLSNNLYAVFLVMVYCYVPFMFLPIYTVVEKLNLQLLEASADLGATPWQTFIRVTLPLSLSGVKNGIMLVLIPSFGEYVIPSLLGGGKQLMVGSLISHYFLVVNDNAVGAAFTVVSGLVLLSVVVVLYLFMHTSLQFMVKSEKS
jgi:spermidine/putrescine transport system permease protein